MWWERRIDSLVGGRIAIRPYMCDTTLVLGICWLHFSLFTTYPSSFAWLHSSLFTLHSSLSPALCSKKYFKAISFFRAISS